VARLDDPAHQREADARALGLGVELIEEVEHLLLVARLDADAVVGDEQDPLDSVQGRAV
jgi:hypothetical protein